MQEYTLSGLDASTHVFILSAAVRVLIVYYIRTSMDADPTLNFNPIAYWAPLVLTILTYEAAFSTYFIDVPRVLVGSQDVIDYSNLMHDRIAQFWRMTSILPVIPDLFGLISVLRTKGEHVRFGISRILPLALVDVAISLGLFFYAI